MIIITNTGIVLDPKIDKTGNKEKTRDYNLGGYPVLSEESNEKYKVFNNKEDKEKYEMIHRIFNNSKIEESEYVGYEHLFQNEIVFNNITYKEKSNNYSYLYVSLPVIICLMAVIGTVIFKRRRQ